MKSKYTIQIATPADALGIAKVHVDTWRSTYRGAMPDLFLDSLSYEKREERWKGILGDPSVHNIVLVAKDFDGSVIGFSNAGKNRDTSLPFDGEIFAIYLRKEFHGQVIGKILFLTTFQQLVEQGFSKAMLWVLEDSPTINFYKAMDGHPVGEKWEEIGGKNLKEIAFGWSDLQSTLSKFRLKNKAMNTSTDCRIESLDA